MESRDFIVEEEDKTPPVSAKSGHWPPVNEKTNEFVWSDKVCNLSLHCTHQHHIFKVNHTTLDQMALQFCFDDTKW